MAKESITKIKLKLFLKNTKRNWELFKEHKLGLFGLIIIIAFGLFALSYPIVWQFVDKSIYDPVTGTDPRVQDISYVSKYMSPLNVIKGIEIPAATLFTYSFLDQGEDFKKAIEKRIDVAQKIFVNLDYAQAFRPILDAIVDNYIPMKERMRYQNQISQLLDQGLIEVKPLANILEIGNRKKFSLSDFKKLVKEVDTETLAMALAPYKSKREVSRITLWLKIAKGSEEQKKFKNLLRKDFSEKEIKEAQEKIFSVVSNLVRKSLINVQISVANQKDLEEIIKTEKVPVQDLAKATIFNVLVDILTYSKISGDYDSLIAALKNSQYSELLNYAEIRMPDLSNEESKKSNYERVKQYLEEIETLFSQLDIKANYSEPVKLLDVLSGIKLAILTFDFSPEFRAKVETALSNYPDIQYGFRKELEALFIEVANARAFMASIISDITEESPENIKIPDVYLNIDFTQLIPAMDKPVVSLLSFATKNTKHYNLIISNIENAGDINYKRLDIVKKMKELSKPINSVKLLLPDSDIKTPISRYLFANLVKDHIKYLKNKEFWTDEFKDYIAYNQNDLGDVVKQLNSTFEISQKEAKESVVNLYNNLALNSKLGIQHPLPPNRWHLLGTDPGGRDIFMQLLRSTPSEFMLGFLAALITVVIGTIVGTTAAYFGGAVDTLFMRLADLILLFPGIAFLIVLSGFFQINLFWLALILGLLGGFGGITLVIKAQALTVKVKPYIEAARVAGGNNAYIIFNHIIPNVMPLSFLYMMFNVTAAVFSEAVLSFFGLLRIRISWGIMINTAWTSGYLSSGNIGAYWWLWVPAGLIITIFCSGFYFLGRGLEEIVNPRLRKR
ncbi:ABC transporter permease subunit [Thermosipho ferrireducens]|uniref:ABC transporter permease subunit n=1 Tax=Thermosipho ferrireducens TaxID=2571116 RepID=A0ABX7S8W8_9BACT|nr:ABC transporter permease subunit [Thermosipho ferrireducens]QTA37590.1 ABC transporter permease subunit [Thermosipho ferrireducens]